MKKTIRFSASLLAFGMVLSSAGCSGMTSSSAGSGSSSVSAASVSGASVASESETAASVVMGSVVAAASDAETGLSSSLSDSSAPADMPSDSHLSDSPDGDVSSSADAVSSPLSGASSVSADETAASPAEGSNPDDGSAEETDSFDAGTNTAYTYRNTWFGIRFRLPAEWSFAEKSQLEEMNQAVSDKSSAEEIRSALSGGQTWFDMYATSDDGYQNLNITVQNIKAVYGALADVDTLVDTSLEPLQSALEAQGAEDISITKGTIDFAGENSVCTRIQGSVQGIPFYETQVYKKEGSYILCATAVSYSEDQTGSILSGVKKI